MFKKSNYILLLFIVFHFFSCSEKSTEPKDEDTVTDIDGNVYKTVKIGDQWWMAENLKVRHYRNGDEIPNVTVDTTWFNTTAGAYCNLYHDTAYADTFGSLYNWYAVNDIRNIAPVDWHVPSYEDYQILEDYLGGKDIAGGKMKATGTIEGGDGLWYNPNTGASNSSGFSALPGGDRSSGGSFQSIGYAACFWTSTEGSDNFAWLRFLRHDDSTFYHLSYFRHFGNSVRCVRD
jgi:uncharacterized protein (TIGR02145 family)